MIKEYLLNACRKMNIEITQEQTRQFELYYKLLLERNKSINLTRITSPEEVAVKHFADSLSLLKYCDIPRGCKLVDVGTGAGFPGIPLKIVRDDIELTLLDSLNKRLVFLGDLCSELKLRAQLVHSRAEDYGKGRGREAFDVAVSRAVAQLDVLSEYALPLVKVGGSFAAMKGPDLKEELNSAQRAIEILGGATEKVTEFSLPEGGLRTILSIRKIKSTPEKYPRTGAKIKKEKI